MTRFPDWQSRLHDFLVENNQRAFQWHDFDCSSFSTSAIFAMTGTDLFTPYRNRYSTQLGSLRTIKRITGGMTVEDAATHAAVQFNLEEIDPRLAKRGDWLLLMNNDHRILGIVGLDGRHAVAVSESGVIFLPLTCAIRAWRI